MLPRRLFLLAEGEVLEIEVPVKAGDLGVRLCVPGDLRGLRSLCGLTGLLGLQLLEPVLEPARRVSGVEALPDGGEALL